MNLPYEIFNGELIRARQPLFTSANRAFRYGDGLYETLLLRNGKPLFLTDHIERLKTGMNFLHLKWPSATLYGDFMAAKEQMTASNKNINQRLRLTVFRESPGYYQPSSDEACWLMTGTAMQNYEYDKNPAGLKTGLFREEFKTKEKLSNIKSLNCLVYVLAGITARNNGWDEVFLMNTDGNIIEATSSNVILIKQNVFITPPLSEGCLDGVMRKNVLKLLKIHNYQVTELPISDNDLMDCNEILLTNVINGVRWVESYNGKKFQNTFSGIINGWLNDSPGNR